MNDPVFMERIRQSVYTGQELEWLLKHYTYYSNVPLNETPIINFRNYRYKITETFVMTYKQEKALLDVEIATPDILVMLGTYAEYKISDQLIEINDLIKSQTHSWNKILALAKNDVRLLVNLSFAIMHLFAADMIALSDNEIVFCYIVAASIISIMDKVSRARVTHEIQKRGLRRPQNSISGRAQTSSFVTRTTSIRFPRDTGKAESAYTKAFDDIMKAIPMDAKAKAEMVEVFIGAAKRLSVRQACLRSFADMGKDLPQLGRLLHLGRKTDTEPNQLVHYIGEDAIALPASNLGDQRYKKDSRRGSMW